jgi:hypothetical protein
MPFCMPIQGYWRFHFWFAPHVPCFFLSNHWSMSAASHTATVELSLNGLGNRLSDVQFRIVCCANPVFSDTSAIRNACMLHLLNCRRTTYSRAPHWFQYRQLPCTHQYNISHCFNTLKITSKHVTDKEKPALAGWVRFFLLSLQAYGSRKEGLLPFAGRSACRRFEKLLRVEPVVAGA